MFSRAEKCEAATRELIMRRRVYPRWVKQGRMMQEKASREIALMEAIRDDYAEPDLFGDKP